MHHPAPHRRLLSILTVTAIACATLGAGGVLGIASATPATTAQSTQSWAYGADTTGNASWTNLTGGYDATLSATFGWHTILTQTNRSDTTYQVEVDRTMALDYTLIACKPDCSNPTVRANASVQALESEVGFVNLTTAATVTEAGQAVPALGILNASDQLTANLTESLDGSAHALLSTKTTSYYFTVQAESHAALTFAPALGLIPLSLTPGATWNSTSEFAATGGWTAQMLYLHTSFDGVRSQLSRSLPGTVAANGSVAVFGRDAGSLTLANGAVTTAIAFAVQGPFHFREGLLLVPGSSDIFGRGDQSWAGYQNDSASAETSSVNFGAAAPHVGFLASATSYSPKTASPSAVGPVPSDSNGGAIVQAQPESVASAESGMTCLKVGSCPQVGEAAPGRTAGNGGAVLLIALIVTGVLVASAVVVRRRREVPPPPHPNAQLYPAGQPFAPRTPRSPRTPETPPPDDPLANLW